MEVREFADGCDIAQPLLVRDVELRPRRDGGEYLKVLLGDRSGSVPAVIWDEVQSARELCIPGQVVHASGRYCLHPRYGPQLAIQAIRASQPEGNLWIGARRAGLGGRSVRLTVSDNGPGVPDEIRSRLFLPFSTTKAPSVAYRREARARGTSTSRR